jgi:hypothetical protein
MGNIKVKRNGIWENIGGLSGKSVEKFTFVLYRGVNAQVGTNVTNKLPVTGLCSPQSVFIIADTPPTGASLIVDIKADGVSLWNTTPGNRPKLLSGEATGSVVSTFDTTTLPAGTLLSVDIVQVGSTTPGQGISVVMRCE